MMKLELKTGNAALRNPLTGEEDDSIECLEIQRILLTVAKDVGEGKKSGKCIDTNGNVVGKWSRN